MCKVFVLSLLIESSVVRSLIYIFWEAEVTRGYHVIKTDDSETWASSDKFREIVVVAFLSQIWQDKIFFQCKVLTRRWHPLVKIICRENIWCGCVGTFDRQCYGIHRTILPSDYLLVAGDLQDATEYFNLGFNRFFWSAHQQCLEVLHRGRQYETIFTPCLNIVTVLC